MIASVNDSSSDGVPAPDGLPVFERLKAALESAGVLFKHTRHEPVYTSAEAAAIRGVSLHSGAKALILKADGTTRITFDFLALRVPCVM